MNRQESDILNALTLEPFLNQRRLAEISGHSLGIVNRSVKELIRQEYLDDDIRLTPKARELMRKSAPKNAIILAAGFGMRMVPINMETPKALLEVNGERIIERLIKQLHEVGIREIYVVVGFMKEQFEYLMDEYGVELIVNNEYAAKNNLHSLGLAVEHISNSYIVPCDIWCDRNPFRKNELYSWYMVSDLVDEASDVRVNRRGALVTVPRSQAGNTMVGISYILEEDAVGLRKRILALCGDAKNDGEFWEKALYRSDGKRELMTVSARLVRSSDVVEINTYEQLRELDGDSMQLKSDAISTIKKVFHVSSNQITRIQVLKKGMTNRSFVFVCKDKKYIMRIPGEGTEKLINRREEAQVYQTLSGKGLCDDPVYINPENGYKITSYLEGIRCCDPGKVSDLKKCMAKLREFHEMKFEGRSRI